MSGYSIYGDDKIDSDYDFISNFRSNRYSPEDSEDDDSENFGEPITITMPTENIDKLQYESKFKDISFNTIINQIIKNHLDWYSNTLLENMSSLPKLIITNAISQLTERQLFEFAQSAVNDLQKMSLLLRGESSFSSFLDILNTWLRITQTPSRFDETLQEYKIVIRHDMGYKYSLLLKEVFRLITEERFHKSFHYNMTENLILIRSAK
jgi:hypothetical protein